MPSHGSMRGKPGRAAVAGYRRPYGRLPVAALIALSALLGASSVFAEDYVLGPQDKLRIRVFEWRPMAGAAVEWAPLTGEFVISPAGTCHFLSLGLCRPQA